MTQAEKRNLRWVITVAHDRSIRLYPAVLNVGVGRRGPCETFVQLHTGLLKDQDAGLLWMLFSADALVQGKGAVYRLLADSSRFSGTLAEALRERIYGEVMPRLAKGIADARRHPNKDDAYLRDTLQMATHVLFRLLFIAYAEDKDLLPYRTSPAYQRNSLKTLATDILDDLRKGVKWGDTTRFWDQFSTLSQAISKGNKSLSVPAYNGVLFSDDADDSIHGHALTKVKLKDALFAPVLSGLLLTHADGKDLGPVDFRSLGVREFGTIYEGLLESELSEAAEDLILKNKDGDQIYATASKKDEPAVREGEFYLHNKSGARKASGAYFTKEFAVDHLLDLALDKALDDHLVKLDPLTENDAAEAIFDFRVADIAMGSGHFLIFAIDRIERKFRSYLEKRPLPAVKLQLQELREAAKQELGDSAAAVENKLEDAALLRRLIARRCIYGVDMNPISVQLAQLAVWIHTFVPGLPLSFLEHNLIQGNSLVGVANQKDFEDLLDDASLAVKGYLDKALPNIKRMGQIADRNVADVREMKKLRALAKSDLMPAIASMDVAVWARASGKTLNEQGEDLLGLLLGEANDILRSKAVRAASEALKPIGVCHIFAAWPEVFLRKQKGFDVLIGNPPWEKVKFEDPMYWSKQIPGYYGLSMSERSKAETIIRAKNKKVDDEIAKAKGETEQVAQILRNLYSDPSKSRKVRYGKTSGDPDLFKMFCWRFWDLLGEGGRTGVVLPRTAVAGEGMEEWRMQMLGDDTEKTSAASLSVTMLVNRGTWVFDIQPQITISLCLIHKCRGKNALYLNGPFSSISEFNKGRLQFHEIGRPELFRWSSDAKLPLLPNEKAISLFRKIRTHGDISGHFDVSQDWQCRPFAELHSTSDKPLYDMTGIKPKSEVMPVYKGESIDIWEPDRGEATYYAWTKSKQSMLDKLYTSRLRSFSRGPSSPYLGYSSERISSVDTIECLECRIGFRDVTRATDTRTMRAALLPPNVVATGKVPVLLWPKGSKHDEAYVLGILSSRTCDWYTRRWVEMGMKFYIFNSIPCPRASSDSGLYKELVASAGRLACPDKRFAKWAKSVEVEHGPLKPEEKQGLVDRVDAVAALLYGLSEQELETVFETFHEGWDWKPSYTRVLAEYRRLKTKHKI